MEKSLMSQPTARWAQYRHEFKNENVKEFTPNYKERIG